VQPFGGLAQLLGLGTLAAQTPIPIHRLHDQPPG